MKVVRSDRERRNVVAVVELRGNLVAHAELEWFFNESAPDMGDVSNFLRVLGLDDDGRTIEDHAEAVGVYNVILRRLRAMPSSDAGVLQTAYEPRCWPRTVLNEFRLVAGIAVRLMATPDEWPEDRTSQLALDSANAHMLADMCVRRGPTVESALQRLRLEAQGSFGRSIAVYKRIRGTGPSVLGRFGRQP